MKTFIQLHLVELKYHFILFLITFSYLFLISYFFSNQLIYILIKKNILKYFIFTKITEFFYTKIIISIFISMLISFQIFILQFWFFLSPGLFQYENFQIFKFYIFFLIFNLMMIPFMIMKMIPNLLLFFINQNFSNQYLFNIYFEPNLNHYFHFIFFSYIYIYLILIYFLILFYTIYHQIFQIQILIHFRKIFYLKFILISNLISPPDLVNQICILILFILVFEILIYIHLYLDQYK